MNDGNHKHGTPGPMLRPEDFQELLEVARLPARPPWLSLQALASYWLTIQSETTTRRQIRPVARTVQKLSLELANVLSCPRNYGHAAFVTGLTADDRLLIHDPISLLESIRHVSTHLEAAQKAKGRSAVKWVENPLALLLLEYYAIGGQTGLPSNEDGPNLIAKNAQHAFAKRFIQILHLRAHELDEKHRGNLWTTELVDYLKASSAGDTTLVRLLRRARKRSRSLQRTWLYPNGRSFRDGRTVFL